jgi:hypothetical protein
LLLQPSKSLSQKEKEREKQNPPLKSPPLEKRKEKQKGKKKENCQPLEWGEAGMFSFSFTDGASAVRCASV